jgi:hypothetical protein
LHVVDCWSHEQEAQSLSLKQVSPKSEGPGVQPEPLLEEDEVLLELLLDAPGHPFAGMPGLMPPAFSQAGQVARRQLLALIEAMEGAPQTVSAEQSTSDPPEARQFTRQVQFWSLKQAI